MTLAKDFRNISFITYRILPFIIVAYFFISSILSGDLSGFLILVGIILSSLITIIVSKSQYIIDNIFGFQISVSSLTASASETTIAESLAKCNFITIGETPLSYLPLSTHIYFFLFGYFCYVIGVNGVFARNWFLILIMSILLSLDGYYNFNACVGNLVLVPIIIGVISGVGWAVIVGPKNHMIPLISTKSQCSAQQSRYSCRIKRTGQIVNTQ
jgi:hypothetical protein